MIVAPTMKDEDVNNAEPPKNIPRAARDCSGRSWAENRIDFASLALCGRADEGKRRREKIFDSRNGFVRPAARG